MKNSTEFLKAQIYSSLILAGWKPFTKSDWYAFCDASLINNELQPLIKEENGVTFIYDNTGFCSFNENDELGTSDSYVLNFEN